MAKAKKKSKGLSNKVNQKKCERGAQKAVNPFEIRFSRQKHSVLNRPVQKDVGKPGISRAKSIQKRKKTLLQEYKLKDKSNMFVDKRIGELDSQLSMEDKMIARFTAERMKKLGKRSIFNLGGEETLTHFGRSLADVERLDDDPRSDDDDDEDSKKLSADYVNEAHFGGFMSRSDFEFAEGKSNSRKDWIENMIAESKKRKAERLRDHESTLHMTEDLDAKWKEMMSGLKTSGWLSTTKAQKEEDAPGGDSYTALMRELAMESGKAKATERLKTEEELRLEEKEKLEKLEADRLRRMRGDADSGDDSDAEAEEEKGQGSEEEEEDNSGEETGDEHDEEEEEDGYSDLEESDEERIYHPAGKESAKHRSQNVKSKDAASASKDIPFVFSVPTNYDQLLEMFQSRSADDKSVILDRVLKCNHPSFGENNKERLESLFTFLLQHVHDLVDEEDPQELGRGLQHVHALMPHMFDLAALSPQSAAKAVLSVIQEKYDDFCKDVRRYPSMATLIFFKLVVLLFPSSDYRHPVVTPALHFMSQVLCKSRPCSASSIASGLFISSILVECVSMNSRFSPELLNFLTGIVYLAIPKTVAIPFVPPFRVVGRESSLLYDALCGDRQRATALPDKLKPTHLLDERQEVEEPTFAASALLSSLKLLTLLADLWKDLPAATAIFRRLSEELLPKLPQDRLCDEIKEQAAKLSGLLQQIKAEPKNSCGQTAEPRKAVTMLKLYEPDIIDDFDPFRKQRPGSKEKRDKDKLLHKIKREKKSAKKELRADTVFLAKQKAKEIRDRDMDRQRRTKEILSGLGSQEGEFRKFQATKKKRK